MTEQEVSPEVRTGSENEPPWWANKAREDSHQHCRCSPQHQRGQSTPFWGRGATLCLSHCCEKRKSSHSAPKVLSTIFDPVLSMFFSLNILPSHSWKALCLPSLLPFGYFHNGVSVLYELLTLALLCGKRRDTPVSSNIL